MDNVIKIALQNELEQLKGHLKDSRKSLKEYRATSLTYYMYYKRRKTACAAYEDAIARIEKELKNGK